ncbi:MAG: BMC domain-containing protein [Synergistales bacterium]|jgi:microcompartment protein CcmL/EutN
MMRMAIATVELISVARGVLAADTMLKAASVTLYEAHPICPGKFIIVVGGEVGAVEESLKAGLLVGREAVSDSMILPNVHPDVFRALAGSSEPGPARAIGIVETMAGPCAIEAADAAAKAASVTLVEIRIGRGMGAKAFFSFLGEVADVHAAAEAARAVVAPRGLLVDIAEITGPHPDLPMVVL